MLELNRHAKNLWPFVARIIGIVMAVVGWALNAKRPGMYPGLGIALIVIGALLWLGGLLATSWIKKTGKREGPA